MDSGTLYAVVIGIIIGTSVLAIFIWGVSTGAFEHAEDAKYILFRDDDDDDD